MWKICGLYPYFVIISCLTQPQIMAEKRTMTLNLTDAEMSALEELATKKDLNKTVVIRQALRLYQMVDQRLREGKKVFIEDEMTKAKSELMFL
jgi:predicted transcriptional regulator